MLRDWAYLEGHLGLIAGLPHKSNPTLALAISLFLSSAFVTHFTVMATSKQVYIAVIGESFSDNWLACFLSPLSVSQIFSICISNAIFYVCL